MTEPIEGEIVEPETNGKKHRRGKKETTAIATRTPGIEELMAQAVDTGNMDTIERVFALRQELKREAAKEAFFTALSRFQSLVPEIPKRKKGYGYLYAPLGAIEKAIKDAARECGLSKRWVLVEDADVITVSCVVTHTEGHSESTSIGPVGWDLLEKTERMNGLQHRAAVIQYLQRYTAVAALGLATADEDTDGGISPEEARKVRAAVSQPQQKPTAQKLKKVTNEQSGARSSIVPAPDGEAIEASTIKVLTSKMEHAALSNGDLKSRFPAISGIEQINRKDINAVLAWIIDPQNA